MINAQIADLSSHNTKYTSHALKVHLMGFFGVDTLLFDGMLVPQQVHDDVADAAEDEDTTNEISAEPTLPSPTPTTTPPPQQELIPSPSQLKQRVKRLEKKRKLKASGFKRLRKAETAQRVKSSADTIMDDHEDVSKHGGGGIAKLDADEDVTLEEVDAEKDADVQGRVVIIQDPEEAVIASLSVQSEVKSKDKGKGILVEEPKPLKRQAQIEHNEAFARELEAELNANINWNEVIEQVKRKERQDNTIMRYQALKRKPITEAQARKNIRVYLKNMVGSRWTSSKERPTQ
nr:hypothetical protein [Tanacetum cinerariifolium]